MAPAGLKSRHKDVHHSKPVLVAVYVHGLQLLFAMVIVSVKLREAGAFNMGNTNETLLLGVLQHVKRLGGDIFAHNFGQRRITN